MRVDGFLSRATKQLQAAGVSSARLDSLILLEDALHKDRSWLLAHTEHQIRPEQLKKLDKQLSQRSKHEPLAYIRGFTEFYGRRFKVNRHVLEPRPESETMIDLVKKLANRHQLSTNDWQIADVGTGNGAIGITAALELHNHNIDLFDIDASALAVAKHNCALHELHLRTVKRDLLRNSHKPYDVVLANLPYVPNRYKLNKAAKLEPAHAIFGGEDGLDLYRRLFEQLTHFSWRPKYVLTESLPPQHEELAKIAKNAGFTPHRSADLIKVFSISRRTRSG